MTDVKELREEDKKSCKSSSPSDKLYLLMQIAQTKVKAHREKNPWRAAIPWWYSVSQVKYEDTSQPICKVRLKNKTYAFPQRHQKIDNKEVQQFYDKQIAVDCERVKADFLQAFRSTIWMTYRKDFSSMKSSLIPKAYHYTTDSGWGCMIRSCQMLFSNSVLRHLFGEDFSLELLEENKEAKVKYLSILWQFMDNLNGQDAAFSIGNIVGIGLNYGINPKNWYGPSTVIQILDELNEKHLPFQDFRTAAFPEGVIYKDLILTRACGLTTDNVEKHWKNAVLVLVGFRLGLDSINPEHYPGIFRLLDNPYCTGIVGGQNRGALYFIGYQDNELIFLDPHVTQSAVPKVVELWTQHLSYHYSTPLKLPIEKLDTCVAYSIGGYEYI